MKLVNLAKKAIKFLQDAGEKGINNIELAEKLQMPRRRVYDIIAILRAAGLVESRREKGGTHVFWVSLPSIESSTVSSDATKISEKLQSQLSKLKEENNELKDKIKRLQEDLSKSGVEKVSKKQKFDSTGVVIRADKSLKITEVLNSGIEVTVKANGKGIIVEPISEDSN
ncbi:MAG: hypothetical protein ACTSYB_03600 [Candidatus Helarchaeota archaeon]